MKSDEAVTSLHTLQRRLREVQNALTLAALYGPPKLLVSEEWFTDALETRMLLLEYLVVRKRGVRSEA